MDDASIAREYQFTEEGLIAMRPSVIRYLSEQSRSKWTDEQVAKILDIR